MNIAYYDGDFDKPQPDGPKRFQMPFSADGDNSVYIYEQDYVQKIEKFKPSTLSSLGDPPYVLVEESSVQSIGNGIGRWTRTYAEVPFERSSWESYAWRVPGMAVDGSLSPLHIDNSLTQQSSSGATLIYTAAQNSLEVGDTVAISYTVKHTADAPPTQNIDYRTVITTPIKGKSFTVARINADVVLWTAVRETGGRQPRTETVTSKIEIDYWHIGAKGGDATTPDAIPIIQRHTISNTLNEETETISPTTSPTLAEWKAKITSSNPWVCVEDSIIRRWMGNIYERSTRYVKAK